MPKPSCRLSQLPARWQSFQLYHVLTDNGVTTQFIAYPVTGHSPADPVHSRDIDRRWIAWLARYLGQ
jgi:dipeptidyl aminopeptidase/acylaminoacyl peptidase